MATRRAGIAVVVLSAAGLLALPVVSAYSEPASEEAPDPSAAEQVSAAQRQGEEPMPLLELVSAGGSGRLYTLDQREAQNASENHGMDLQSGRVGYFPRGGADGTTPLYRLKPASDSTAWLFTVSEAERDSLIDDGWVFEGTAGHVYTDAAPDREVLNRLSNGREWRLALESETDELVEAGYTLDGPVGYVYPQWIRTGAVYFGMFNIDGHQRIIQRTEEVYGREGDWWGGVRDFRDGTEYATDNWPDQDWSDLKPSIGYYDDSDPHTLEQHITQATSAGLSFFSFYWYWNTEAQEPSVTDASLDAFLQAENRDAMDFTVSLCAHPFGELDVPTDQYDQVASLMVEKYLSQDNTLRANDGRKIFNICDARGLGDGSPEQVGDFVETVRSEADEQLGEDIYVQINQAGFAQSDVPAAGADSSYCTTDGPGVESRSYQSYLDGMLDYFNSGPAAASYSRCLMSDFDERPRYPIENTDASTIRYFPDHSMERYREAVSTVFDDIEDSRRPQDVDNIVYVYAWNEWHEGGYIEPNERDGCAYLDVLTEEFRLPSDGCQARPE